MAQTTYQVTMSTGGNIAVTVTTDDPAEMKAGIAWAELAYKHLAGDPASSEQTLQDKQIDASRDEETPICAVHKLPMAKVKGKYGSFWSCHERNADGSFCSYKPEGRRP